MSLTSVSKAQGDRGLQTIGKYEIVGTLGRGSMGIVYKAQDPEIGRFVAVKTLRKIFSAEFHDGDGAHERFKTEARSAGNLRHPNIITIFDANVEGDLPYIVMDYVEGDSLDQLISKEGRLEPADALHIINDVALGIDYAHSVGVIHRDIKPSNILVDRSQRVFILDFGIASMNQNFEEGSAAARSGPVVGTPGYMSPEQILNEALDHRSDLFSLAVVAFECLAGQRPFPGDNFSTVIANILNTAPTPITSVVPGLPLSLETVLNRGMARNREDRFSSAAELVQAMRSALGIEGVTGTSGHVTSGRKRKLSTWKSLSSLSGNIIGGNQPKADRNGDRSSSRRNTGNGNSPVIWNASGNQTGRGTAAPALPLRMAATGTVRPGEFFTKLQDSYVGPQTQGRVRSSGARRRIMTVFLGMSCVFLSGFLFWTIAIKKKLEPRAASLPAVALPIALPNNPLESVIAESGFSPPQVGEVPVGKPVLEMEDREILGVLASRDVSEVLILDALKVARERGIPDLVAASIYPLQNDSYIVRIEAIKTLAEAGDRRIVPALVHVLDDYDPLVRRHCAEALGRLGSTAAIGYLSARLLKEEDLSVQRVIKEAIDGIKGLRNTSTK